MKLFKKSTLGLALTAALTGGAMLGVTAPASAVNVAHDALGDAMVFPFYTVNKGWNTYFNITNTSAKTVIIKVRWREARNSRDVRDFNVVLSPFDVWTAATVAVGNGAGMITSDKSCTFPKLSPRGANTGIDFTNTAYSGSDADTGPIGISRTNEGYFEVFEMGTIDNLTAADEAKIVADNAKHGPASAGDNTAVPASCDEVRKVLRGGDNGVANAGVAPLNPSGLSHSVSDLILQLDPPENNLKGRAVLINAGSGVAAGYDPLTLANFSNVQIYKDPSLTTPNLSNANPVSGSYYDDNTNSVITTGLMNHTADAVSALIMRTAVINDYNVATGSETDFVLNFPTKNFYVDGFNTPNAANFPGGLTTSLPPFDATVNGEKFGEHRNGKSCFDINVSLWDREEFSGFTQQQDGFSPIKPGTSNQAELCYEANILSFGTSNLFDSQVRAIQGNLPGKNGWATVSFGPSTASVGEKLPVIGMRVEERNKGDATINFGFANDHAYRR